MIINMLSAAVINVSQQYQSKQVPSYFMYTYNLTASFIKLTLLLLNTTRPFFANSVDPDQLASEEANWSGSALFQFLSKTQIK